MNFSESTEQIALRSLVREIASEFGHDYFAEKARVGAKTDELWLALAQKGLLGIHLPVEFGGGGAGVTELAIVVEEAAAVGCPMILTVVSAGVCGEVISRFGTPEQKQSFLRQLARGEKFVFAITEADAGTNSHNLTTRARRDGDVYRVSGSKTYISGVDEAETMLVVARTGTDERTGRAQLSLFIVDTDAPGLQRTPIPMETRLPETQFTLFFDDVEVPADRLVGTEGEGLRTVFYGLNPERITGACLSAGLGRYVLDTACDVAGRSPDDLAYQAAVDPPPLEAARIKLELSRLMISKAAWLHDHGGGPAEAGEAANMAKYAAAEAGLDCFDTALKVLGPAGHRTDGALANVWGQLRLNRIAPISREMVLNFIAQHSLGLPKSY